MSQLITNSRRACWLACPRRHQIAYTYGIRPVASSAPQRRGSLWHAVRAGADPGAIEDADPYLRAAVLALDSLYSAPFTPLDDAHGRPLLEVPFIIPTPTHNDGGVIDGIVTFEGRTCILERKTREGLDDNYWAALAIDAQLSTYVTAARALGHAIHGVVYEVQEWPSFDPHRATPVERRKYTKAKPCKAHKPEIDPACEACEPSRLYATQRDQDETPAEFHTRVLEWAQEQPRLHHRYVPILNARLTEYEADKAQIDALLLAGAAYRNPGSCAPRGRVCDYLAICTNPDLDIYTPDNFVRLANINPEVPQ